MEYAIGAGLAALLGIAIYLLGGSKEREGQAREGEKSAEAKAERMAQPIQTAKQWRDEARAALERRRNKRG